MKKWLWLLLSGLSLVSITGCKDTDDEDSTSGPAKVTIPMMETAISDQNKDPYAIQVKYSVESMNSLGSILTSFYIGFEGYNWVKDGNTYTWQQTNGKEAIKYVVTDNGSTYTTRFYITGEMGGFTVNNALQFEGTYSKDGKSGNWKIYEFTSATVSFIEDTYEWSTNSAGTLSGELKTFDSASDAKPDSYSASTKADKSGTLLYKENDVKLFDAVWATDGSGTLTYYDSNGTVTNTYSWTKNP